MFMAFVLGSPLEKNPAAQQESLVNHMRALGQTGPQWAITFLGPFMVVALWIFPEVAKK